MSNDIFSLREAIIVTVRYFNSLDFPLTLSELSEYLYGWSAEEGVIKEDIKQIPEISYTDGFYFLKGRNKIVNLRKERKGLVVKFWRKIRRFSWLVAFCPFVKMAGVVNGVAYGNVNPESDIDLFVIVKKNRLGASRFFMKLFTHIFGMRVHHGKKAFRFCLSFFVTEEAMNLEPLAHEFDPHFAYFVSTLKPLFGEKTYYGFLKENAWTDKYFKKTLKPHTTAIKKHSIAVFFRFVFELFIDIFGDFWERVLYQYQNKRDLERKKNFSSSDGIVLNKKTFKFHEEDPRKLIARDFLDFFK